MAVKYGDEVMDLLISGTLSFNTIHDFPPSDLKTITFTDQDLNLTRSSIVYGDMRNLTLEAKAVSNQTEPGVWLTAVDSYVFDFGHDKLSLGNKNNIIFGDIQDLYMHTVGGVSSKGVITNAWISQNIFNFGDDEISAGDGKNIVYGDTRDLTMIGEKGINLDSSQAPFPLFGELLGGVSAPWFNTLIFGSDKILLGNGDNSVYGDVQDIDFVGLSGMTDVVTGAVGQGIANGVLLNSFTFGDDDITVGNGTNLVYGDFRDMLALVSGGKTFGQENGTNTDTNGFVYLNSYNFGNDLIKIGDGTNTVYGDGRSLTLEVKGGHANGGSITFGFVDGEVFNFGDDIIMSKEGYSAQGKNIVYGDLQNLTFDVEGGHAVASASEAASQIRQNTFVMGSDSIALGNGGNQIYGDMGDYTIRTDGGVNAAPVLLIRHSAVIGNDVHMGDDILTSGAGADHIYGDAHNITWEAVGGIASVNNAPASLSLRFDIPNSIEFGSDIIHAGDGNDFIVGDALGVSLKAIGGRVSQEGLNAIGWVNEATLVAGDDRIYGEAGDDNIFGDMQSLSLSVHGGIVSGSGGDASAHMINTNNTFGNDLLEGGDGSDVLYGDLATLNFSAIHGKDSSGVGDSSATFSGDIGPFFGDETVIDVGSTIMFGDDVIEGGEGDDFICGDVLNINGLSLFLVDFNQIVAGNDVLSGGLGSDTFAFSLDLSFGDDTIVDFSTSQNDILMFNSIGDAIDLTSLKSISHVEDDGSGKALFVIDSGAAAGSSISFENIAFVAGYSEIDNYVDADNIVIL